MTDPRKRAFTHQKSNAKARGIGFHFTYNEWVAWWHKQLGPKWFELRGCKSGQFCMARNGDKGPYRVDNIKCVSASQNSAEGTFHKGNNNPRAKITERQAMLIKHSSLSSIALSKRYKLSRVTIDQIKNGTRWKHLAP